MSMLACNAEGVSDLSPASGTTEGDPHPTPFPKGMGRHDPNHKHNLASIGST